MSGLAERRLDHGAEADGRGEAQLLLADAGADRAVDLLEVDVLRRGPGSPR